MGSEQVSDSHPTIKEFYWSQLPHYLSFGMSADEFWNGDVDLAKAYYKAYKLRRQQRNQELWLQGMYFYEALGDIAPILHAFADRNSKARPYPIEPYPLTAKERREQEEREQKRKYEASLQKMKDYMTAHNQKYKS